MEVDLFVIKTLGPFVEFFLKIAKSLSEILGNRVKKWEYSGFELTDWETQFTIYLDYFAEHFFPDFHEICNFKSMRQFNFRITYCFMSSLYSKSTYLFTVFLPVLVYFVLNLWSKKIHKCKNSSTSVKWTYVIFIELWTCI